MSVQLNHYTNVRESLVNFFLPRPERIHMSVAMSVTQHKLNSVQPNASTVSVWRHLLETLSSYGRRRKWTESEQELTGKWAGGRRSCHRFARYA